MLACSLRAAAGGLRREMARRAAAVVAASPQGAAGARRGLALKVEDEETHDDFKPRVRDAADAPPVHEHIEKDIKENPVMVFMKGVPDAPQCGFSAMVVQLLDVYGVDYKSRNVLEDDELRQGIKTYSQWPTVPQVYINGEFVGGSDILMSLHRSGELEKKLQELKLSKQYDVSRLSSGIAEVIWCVGSLLTACWSSTVANVVTKQGSFSSRGPHLPCPLEVT
eukprot:SM000079S22506  [mRNA]  locus=s79:517897:526667:- [translate_table: standard]